MSNGFHLGKGSQKPAFPDDGMLTLYSMRFCPYAHRAHLVLNAKKVPFRVVYINLTEKPEWFPEINPLSKVPALDLSNGKAPIVESLVIADYLDEVFPQNPLNSKDPLQKAYDRVLLERFGAASVAMYKLALGTEEQAPEAISALQTQLDVFEQELSERGSTYYGGEKPGMLDYMIWPWIERLSMVKYLTTNGFELDKERFKNLLKWHSLMLQDEAVKEFYLDGETHAKYITTRRAGKADYDMLVR